MPTAPRNLLKHAPNFGNALNTGPRTSCRHFTCNAAPTFSITRRTKNGLQFTLQSTSNRQARSNARYVFCHATVHHMSFHSQTVVTANSWRGDSSLSRLQLNPIWDPIRRRSSFSRTGCEKEIVNRTHLIKDDL